jgi:transposase
LIGQRTQLINALRAHLAELGLVAEQGRDGLAKLAAIVSDERNVAALPAEMCNMLQIMLDQLTALHQQIGRLDRAIMTQHKVSEQSRRLESIPGIGVIGATAIAATITDPSTFRSGRDLAAWIGLVPRQNSTGGKERLGGISKQGDRYLRRLLVLGATAVIRHSSRHPEKHPWIMKLLAKKPAKVVAIAVANKMARIAWAILANGGIYRAPTIASST